MENKTGLPDTLIQQVLDIVKEFPEITEVKLYGSRAKGNYRKYSDVDLAIFGRIDGLITGKIREELEELDTIYQFDVVHFDKINNEISRLNIENEGVSLHSIL